MRNRHRGDDGVAAVELGLVLPVLMLLLGLAVPLIHAGIAHVVMNRAVAAGIRYASRVDTNARYPAAECGGGPLTRRPNACEVDAVVREAAGAFEPTSVRTFVDGAEADPSAAVSGQTVSILVTYDLGFGPVPDLVNGIKAVWFEGRGAVLPESTTLTFSAWGREE